MWARLAALALVGLATLGSLGTAQAQDGPVVVELYTSQGCSSCPPADAMLHKLAKREGVIALALHVDYWDYIGWKDSFARPEHTQRQKKYAQVAGKRSIYTPQMVIQGQDHVVGARPMEVMDIVARHSAAKVVAVEAERQGEALVVRAPALADPSGPVAVQLVRYLPLETVKVRRGENAGKTLSYANIVTSWDVVETWSGEEALEIRLDAPGEAPVVVILQRGGMGPIIGAAALE